ncbi:MAG TPA: glycosyltransferase family 2 protein [Mycobacteriales bacterium]|jgi:GT2 family glycosyltransferase|nr:glycosyltransferase family 2 protein [Mycobacteriales bacterium]
MPSRAPRLQFADQVVTAVVVVHDGAAWLAGCLEALRAQRRRPQRLVVVDTGSADGSAELARTADEEIDVVRLPAGVALADAVAAGLAAVEATPSSRRRGPVVHWVWLVHDDCRPEPDALLELLAEADRSPSATVLGCKQTDLDGRHLLEMGATVDGSGRRRTGVEPHEVDQGQHDELRDVLAVGTAGMLVRRDVWERLGGLDPVWPVHGEDIDFGWRANAAGERVVVVPRAVVRHAFALARGERPTAALPGRPGVVRRRHELQVLWANAGSAVLPLLVVRTVLGGWLVALARLSAADFRGARDEAGAVLSALRHPSVVTVARRRRRALQVRSHRELRPLLGSASAQVRRDLAARFASRRVADGAVDARRGWRDRPLLWLSVFLIGLALVADRGALGGSVHGGRLLPAPAGASDLWSAYLSGWHAVGLGSSAPTPPWVAVLAAASTLLFGKPWLVVAAVMLGAAPLAGWSAYGAGSALTRSRWLRASGAGAYALLPAGLGAVSGGRLDVVVVVVLLPVTALVLARAMLPTDPSARAARPVAAGLMLALGAAFAPALWGVLGLAALAAIVLAVRPIGPALGRLLVALAAAFVVLLPWSWHVVAHASSALYGAGPADTFRLARAQPATDFVLLHPGGPAQPATWLLAGYLLAAVAGLARSNRQRVARAAFAAFVVAAGAALAISRLHVPGGGPEARYWTGVPLAVAGLAVLSCAVVAGDAARSSLARYSFGWRQLAATVVTAAVVIAVIGSSVTWLGRGVARPLSAGDPQLLPAFAAATVELPASPRALVLRPEGGTVGYTLVRSAGGPRLGDADLGTGDGDSARPARELAGAVSSLVGGDPQAASLLTEFGVTQVVDRAADDRLLAGVAGVDGLTGVKASGVVVRRTAVSGGELTVLAPDVAARVAAGHALPDGAVPTPIPATAGHARAHVPAGPGGRLLVLAESADTHWEARLDGRPLARATAYGWAQAWRLPARGGRLALSRSSDGRAWWLTGELVALVLLGLAALPRRRREVVGS